MILKNLSLQGFRNYSKADFTFSSQTTIIIGPNGVGKSNLIEAVFLLATGKSFRADKELQLIQFEKQVTRIKGLIAPSSRAKRGDLNKEIASSQAPRNDDVDLEVAFLDQGTPFLKKKYLANGVARRRTDFAGHLVVVLFTPLDLDLVSGSPSNRRRFLDEVLEQIDFDYRLSSATYAKALKQRNALLQQAQETGIRNEKQFEYWDALLIKTGNLITKKREGLIREINERKKDFFNCSLFYDRSEISAQRLEQYKNAEIGSGVTLVGPHRDDIRFDISDEKDARYFASRGQQRLIVLEMKLAQIKFAQEKTGKNPILLLDDIFSELDSGNIKKILKLIDHHQIIITTTHREFIKDAGLKRVEMIELNKEVIG